MVNRAFPKMKTTVTKTKTPPAGRNRALPAQPSQSRGPRLTPQTEYTAPGYAVDPVTGNPLPGQVNVPPAPRPATGGVPNTPLGGFGGTRTTTGYGATTPATPVGIAQMSQGVAPAGIVRPITPTVPVVTTPVIPPVVTPPVTTPPVVTPPVVPPVVAPPVTVPTLPWQNPSAPVAVIPGTPSTGDPYFQGAAMSVPVPNVFGAAATAAPTTPALPDPTNWLDSELITGPGGYLEKNPDVAYTRYLANQLGIGPGDMSNEAQWARSQFDEAMAGYRARLAQDPNLLFQTYLNGLGGYLDWMQRWYAMDPESRGAPEASAGRIIRDL